MYGISTGGLDCGLKQVVREASRALAQLDAARLEELARSCEALNAAPLSAGERSRRAREAAAEMEVFARVLDATRANLDVMRRLRNLRQGRADYGEAAARDGVRRAAWMETGCGDD